MRTWIRLSALFLATNATFAAVGCGGGGAGSEGNECYPNGTCDEGLSCLSNICVDPDGGGATGSVDGSDDETTVGVDIDACLSCGESSCSTEADACNESDGCANVLNCWLECAEDQTCVNGCDASDLTQEDVEAVDAYFTCLATECTSECGAADTTDGTGGNSGTGGTSGTSGEACTTEGESRGSCSTSDYEKCLDGTWTTEDCSGCEIITPSDTCHAIWAITLLDATEPVAVDNPNKEVTQTESSVIAEWYLEEDQMGVLTFAFTDGVDPTRVDLEGELSKIQLVTVETESGESGCQYVVESDGRLTRAATIDWNGCWGAWSSYELTEPTDGTRLNIRTETSQTNQDYTLTITGLNI